MTATSCVADGAGDHDEALAIGVSECAPPSPGTPCARPSRPPRLAHFLLNLSPSFFGITMGTGIVSILLHGFPYPARWLRVLGTVVFALNVALYVALVLASAARYVVYRGAWSAVLRHPVSSTFWGTAPMGLVTIVNMVAMVCVPAWGRPAALLALGLWWIVVVASLVVNIGVLFLMITRQTHTPASTGAHWLLPIVTSVVAAASGAVVASALAPFDAALARSTAIAAYAVWGTGVPAACLVIGIWLARSVILGPPAPAAMASMLFPLGPCGQGAYGILGLGTAVRALAYDEATALLPGLDARAVADAVYAAGVVAALVLWGFGAVWYVLAHAVMLDQACRRPRALRPQDFSLGLWGLTFPIGVFATATISLSTALDSPAFRVLGAALAVQVIVNWAAVSALTVYKLAQGTWVVAPELAELEAAGGAWDVRWAAGGGARRPRARRRDGRGGEAGRGDKASPGRGEAAEV